MTLTPMGDRLLIRPSHPEQVTSGGIIIPDSATEKPVQGRVLVVGEGRITADGQLIEPRVSVDDEVLYGRHSGTEISMNGETLLILRESDILEILHK